jgi:hypothetical protein
MYILFRLVRSITTLLRLNMTSSKPPKWYLDHEANHNLYGSSASIQSILDGQIQAPETAQSFLSALGQGAGK